MNLDSIVPYLEPRTETREHQGGVAGHTGSRWPGTSIWLPLLLDPYRCEQVPPSAALDQPPPRRVLHGELYAFI